MREYLQVWASVIVSLDVVSPNKTADIALHLCKAYKYSYVSPPVQREETKHTKHGRYHSRVSLTLV